MADKQKTINQQIGNPFGDDNAPSGPSFFDKLRQWMNQRPEAAPAPSPSPDADGSPYIDPVKAQEFQDGFLGKKKQK